MHPHGHHSVADIFLRPASLLLDDLPHAQKPGADGLGEERFWNGAGKRRVIADIHDNNGRQRIRMQRRGRRIARALECGVGNARAFRIAKEELLVAEDQLVAILKQNRDADAALVDEASVAAAEIDQRDRAAFAPLHQRVQARYRPAIEQHGAAIAAANGPRLAIAQREAASGIGMNEARQIGRPVVRKIARSFEGSL